MPRCPPIVTPLEGQRRGHHIEEARAFVAADLAPAPVSAAFQADKRMNANGSGVHDLKIFLSAETDVLADSAICCAAETRSRGRSQKARTAERLQ